jgi:hypothetical protein
LLFPVLIFYWNSQLAALPNPAKHRPQSTQAAHRASEGASERGRKRERRARAHARRGGSRSTEGERTPSPRPASKRSSFIIFIHPNSSFIHIIFFI